jgi:hypothetical protein
MFPNPIADPKAASRKPVFEFQTALSDIFAHLGRRRQPQAFDTMVWRLDARGYRNRHS